MNDANTKRDRRDPPLAKCLVRNEVDALESAEQAAVGTRSRLLAGAGS